MHLNSMPSWFLGTKAGREAQAEAESNLRDERVSLVEGLEQIRAEADEDLTELNAAALKAEKLHTKAARAFHQTRDAAAEARNLMTSRSFERDRAINALEAQLRMTADPSIQAFQEVLEEEWETTRRSKFSVAVYGPKTADGSRLSVNNYQSIVARMDAIRAGSAEAETLKLFALSDEELTARLAELQAAIPEIEPPENLIPVVEESDLAQPPQRRV